MQDNSLIHGRSVDVEWELVLIAIVGYTPLKMPGQR